METDKLLYQREMAHRLMVPKKKLTVPKEEKRRAVRNRSLFRLPYTHYSS